MSDRVMSAASKSFPQDFLSCGKPLIEDDRFYRPLDAPISPCWTAEEQSEWEYWSEQERLAAAEGESASESESSQLDT